MSLADQVLKLKAIRDEVNAIFKELERLAQEDRQVTRPILRRLARAASELDVAALAAATEHRAAIIEELSLSISQYDKLLALGIAPAARESARAERARLVAQRGYHRGRQGRGFEGVMTAKEVDRLETLIAVVRSEAAGKKKAADYIDVVIRIGVAATRVIESIR